MPIEMTYRYTNLSRHLRYFEKVLMAKGASPQKARAWAYIQVKRKGWRAP